jgi:pimeloyl-ACP methyl ester carboxylesterase
LTKKNRIVDIFDNFLSRLQGCCHACRSKCKLVGTTPPTIIRGLQPTTLPDRFLKAVGDAQYNHIASVMDDFTQALGLSHYTLYMQDYGGPVGFRMALAHPERVQVLIVQDAVAHNEGLGANWATRRAFWADRPAHEEALRKNLLSLATTKTRHIGDDPNVELYDPDLWTDEYAFLNAPGQAQIQSDLFYDYRTKRRCLSKVAGMDAEDAAKAFGPLGQARSLVRSRRAGTLPQGRTEGGGLRTRRRTLRA